MNSFDIYSKNREIYDKFIRHSSESNRVLENKLFEFYKLNEIEQNYELDFFHLIFKHARACDDCAMQTSITQLSQLVVDLVLNQRRTSYPLLICMIDLVKSNDTLSHSTLNQFMSVACSLWNHDKIYMCRKSMELCYRLIGLIQDDSSYIIQNVIKYIRHYRLIMNRDDLENMRLPDYTEFFNDGCHASTFDRGTIKLLVQIILRLFLKKENPMMNDLMIELKEVYDSCIKSKNEFWEILFDICCVNDDDTVQLLDTILLLYQQLSSSSYYLSFLKSIDIDPHLLFLFFLYRCGSTHDILIDLLLENDSEFLAYFHQYIRYTINHMLEFKYALENSFIDLDTLQAIIANVLLILDGDGFPYNTKPLIRRLTQFEELL
ncbi:uncharacterized protein BX663DRAFT_507017 [Cokeromyces recurvatus]|uniref:uncharacterized protein n=1 Tax=Cokeromyces recurvatus TaxID=90255 RepID=UPI00221F7AF2|nr:uncharacterized protein BX663DRAFT_507017 [Cokeromyces recurvatus]KAI7903592.1 hypothetical protein BX663DRAFT_507017 [Cokeromyces recurvatus]